MRSLIDRNSVLALIAGAAARGSNFLGILIVAHICSSDVVGMFGVYLAAVLFCSALANFGINTALARMAARSVSVGSLRKAHIRATQVSGIAGSLLGLFLALFSKRFLPGVSGVSQSCLLMVSVIACSGAAISSQQIAVLSGRREFTGLARVNLIQGIVTLVLLPIGAYFMGIAGLLCANAAASLSLVIHQWVVIGDCLAVSETGGSCAEVSLRKEISEVGIPTVLVNASAAGSIWYLNTLLSSSISGLEVLGAILPIQRLFSLIAQGSILLLQPALYDLARKDMWKANNKRERILTRGHFKMLIVAASTCVLASILPTEVAKVCGAHTAGSELLVFPIAALTFFGTVNAPISNLVIVSGNMWFLVIQQAVSSIGICALAAIYVPVYQEIAFLWIPVITGVTTSIWTVKHLREHCETRVDKFPLNSVSLIGTLGIVILYVSNGLALIWRFSIGFLVCVGISLIVVRSWFWLTRTPDSSD